VTHSITDATALTNGSVSVNLNGAAVDTQSLGLQAYATPPNDTVALGTITGGLTGGVMDLVFAGPGDSTNSYAAGLTVAVQNLGTATSLADVVSNINTAINQTANSAGAGNSTGMITTANVSLSGATTKAQAITAINAQLSAAGGPLAGVFAVNDGAATAISNSSERAKTALIR
jgi:hypothetical protein